MKKKINWMNVIKAIVFVACILVIFHDMVMLLLGASYTWIGLLTFVLICIIASLIYEDFEDQIKSTVSATDQSFRKSTINK